MSHYEISHAGFALAYNSWHLQYVQVHKYTTSSGVSAGRPSQASTTPHLRASPVQQPSPSPATDSTNHGSSAQPSKLSMKKESFAPLAERMRPQDLEDYVGQDKAVGKDSMLYSLLSSDHIPSIILWGPPGCGKVSGIIMIIILIMIITPLLLITTRVRT